MQGVSGSSPDKPTILLNRRFLLLALAVSGFNLWHVLTRGTFGESVFDSLTVGERTLGLAAKFDARIRPWKSYDGQFFYAMTYDPLLITKEAVPYINNPPYRYHRMLYPLLAHWVSGGKPVLYPYALFFLNILAWILSGFALYKIAELEDLPKSLVVLGGLMTTGLVYTTFRTLSETTATCLVLWGCYFFKRDSFWRAAAAFSLAALARETSLLVPFSLIAYQAFSEKKAIPKMAPALLLSAVPTIFWFLYVYSRIGDTTAHELNRFAFPFQNLYAEWILAIKINASRLEYIRTVSIIVESVFLMVLLPCLYWGRRTVWGFLAMVQAAFCAVVGGDIWDFYASSVRFVILLNLFAVLYLCQLDRNSRINLPDDSNQ